MNVIIKNHAVIEIWHVKTAPILASWRGVGQWLVNWQKQVYAGQTSNRYKKQWQPVFELLYVPHSYNRVKCTIFM